MKKIMCVALAALLLCIYPCSMADENDPIVGLWYVLFSKENTPPSLWDILQYANDRVFAVFDCQPDGEVFLYDILVDDSMGELESEFFAKWEKDSESYIINMMGSDKFNAYFKDGFLYFDIYRSNIYLKMRRVEALDWFDDTIR